MSKPTVHTPSAERALHHQRAPGDHPFRTELQKLCPHTGPIDWLEKLPTNTCAFSVINPARWQKRYLENYFDG